MKKICIIFLSFFVLLSFVNAQSENYYIKLSLFTTSKNNKIDADKCNVIFVTQNDSISLIQDSLYLFKKPISNTKLYLIYKNDIIKINTDDYISAVSRTDSIILIDIALSPFNNDNAYSTLYMWRALSHGGKGKPSKKNVRNFFYRRILGIHIRHFINFHDTEYLGFKYIYKEL